MTPRQLTWIAVALVAAVLIWMVTELTGGRPDDRRTAAALPGVAVDSLTLVAITRGADSVLLARFGGNWQVNGHESSAARLDELFRALRDTTESEIVATSPAVHDRMGVDTGGTRVELDAPGGETVLWVGKPASGNPRAAYLRRDGDDTVYAYSGGLVRLAALGVDDWRNKVIADIDPAAVRHVVVERGTERTELVLTDGSWRLGRGEETADSAAVVRFLAALSPLEATGFPTPAQVDSADWSPPDRRLVVIGAGNDTLVAVVFDSAASQFWARHEAGDVVFSVPGGRVNRAVPGRADLLPQGGS